MRALYTTVLQYFFNSKNDLFQRTPLDILTLNSYKATIFSFVKAPTIHRSYFEVFRGHEGLEFPNRVLCSHLPFAKHECLFRNARYVFFFSLASRACMLTYLQGRRVASSSWCKTYMQWGVLWDSPPIYLHLIFAILQFKISSKMNWIFVLAVACKIQVWNRLKIQFIKLDISDWRIAKI